VAVRPQNVNSLDLLGNAPLASGNTLFRFGKVGFFMFAIVTGRLLVAAHHWATLID
jgi:hypothetical protein